MALEQLSNCQEIVVALMLSKYQVETDTAIRYKRASAITKRQEQLRQP